MKNLQQYLITRRRLHELLDGDLFLFCLKAVIFGDLELARVLMDPSLDFMFSVDKDSMARDAVNAPLQRFQDQVDFLVHDLDESYVDRIEGIVGSKRSWSWHELQTDASPCQQANYDELLNEVVSDLLDGSKFSDARAVKTAETCRWLLENRNLLCIGSFETTVKVNEHGRCLVGEVSAGPYRLPYLAVEARPGHEGKEGQGTYEVYFLVGPVERTVCYSVVLGDQCVACGAVNKEAPFDEEEFADRKPSHASAVRMQRQMLETLKRVIGDYPSVEHYLSQTLDNTSRLYEFMCKNFAESLYHGNLASIYGSDLLTLSDRDASFLSNYVAVSLNAVGLVEVEEFEEACRLNKIDVSDFCSRLDELGAKGLVLIDRGGNLVFLCL